MYLHIYTREAADIVAQSSYVEIEKPVAFTTLHYYKTYKNRIYMYIINIQKTLTITVS